MKNQEEINSVILALNEFKKATDDIEVHTNSAYKQAFTNHDFNECHKLLVLGYQKTNALRQEIECILVRVRRKLKTDSANQKLLFLYKRLNKMRSDFLPIQQANIKRIAILESHLILKEANC